MQFTFASQNSGWPFEQSDSVHLR